MKLGKLLVKGMSTSKTAKDFHIAVDGKKAGLIEVKHSKLGWEVEYARVEPTMRGKGIASAAYDVIEKRLKQKMKPSRVLLVPSLKLWKRRDPALIQNYRSIDDVRFLSPRELLRSRSAARAYIRRAERGDKLAQRMLPMSHQDAAQLNQIISTIPAAALRPSILRKTFAIGGTVGAGGAATATSNRSDAARKAAATKRARGDFA